ncbi:hypothetical protein ACK8P5_25605 (plasmid) [Paenibacillus sp. EC2-1]|uniref:hypothetical protein n=1 Tax=Paenibacillus sp. EC2-1 TaxID=3388665 RepID=UPI003BEEDC62
MTQRAGLNQIKNSDTGYRSFLEQYSELEDGARYVKRPVETFGDLPQVGNQDGDECLVKDRDIKYRWNSGLQAWRPLLGKGYDVPNGKIRRYRGHIVATEGQKVIQLNHHFDVGENTLDVYVQGMLQMIDLDYYEVDDTTIEFVTPLEEGMTVTYCTPYLVGNTTEDIVLTQRLQAIEYNHYHLMLNQYYAGKPVKNQGVVFDGFLNTSYIDYAKTSLNMEYDNVNRVIRTKLNNQATFHESFENKDQMSAATNALIEKSEATLPLQGYTSVFKDQFINKSYINQGETTAFVDIDNQRITVDAVQSGGGHYVNGDFMVDTGNVDLVGVQRADYDYNHNDVYSIQPHGPFLSLMSKSLWHIRNVWPYPVPNNLSFHSVDGVDFNRYASRCTIGVGNRDFTGGTFAITEDSKSFMTYLRGNNMLMTINQYDEGSGRFSQSVYSTLGQRAAQFGFGKVNRPDGFGAPILKDTMNLTEIHQVGATEKELIVRCGDVLYFIQPISNTFRLNRTLDFTNSTRKPSLYNVMSKQFTSDDRYLYFPARLEREGVYGYYLEVFDLETGDFVNEVLITTSEDGVPGTTAMAFDHLSHRIILAANWGNKVQLDGKMLNDYSIPASPTMPAFLVFDTPSVSTKILRSTLIKTNLRDVYCKLNVKENLNGGLIEYFIRLGSGAWVKVSPGAEVLFKNPFGAKETSLELRATLRSSVGALKSPEIKEWSLEVKAYSENEVIYESKPQILNMLHVTGGRLSLDQLVPDQTSLQWSIKFDQRDEVLVSQDGSFNTTGKLEQTSAILKARLATNDKLMSPAIRDVTLRMYYSDAGYMESTIYEQIQDIQTASMWLTTNATSEYVDIHISRDGGLTWYEGVRGETQKQQDGSTETRFDFDLKSGDEAIRNKLKVKFTTNGAVDIKQYGVLINPVI